MSRFDPSVMLTEEKVHARLNRMRASSCRTRRCTLLDGEPGVAMTGQGFVLMMRADDAIGLADALVDAVEATGGHEG